MTDINEARSAVPAGMVGEAIGNTLLAFALSFFAARLGLALDVAPRFILVRTT